MTAAKGEGSAADSAASKSAGSPLATAADRLRDAARWLVISFGALVAVVFAGIGISNLGKLDPTTAPHQFWLAVTGAGLALIGAVIALGIAVSLAAAGTVSIYDLDPLPEHFSYSHSGDPEIVRVRDELFSDPQLSPWGGDVTKFFDATRSAQATYDERLQQWAAASKPDDYKVPLDQALQWLKYLLRIQTHVITNGSYMKLRNRFGRATWKIALALLVATAGATLFVWATGTAANETVPTAARSGLWNVPQDSRTIVAKQLGGPACPADLDQVPVVVLGEQGDGAQYDVVTMAVPGCQPIRLVVLSTQVSRPQAP